jgi:hypothetical protein
MRPDGYSDAWRMFIYPDGFVVSEFLGVEGITLMENLWILIRRINTPATEPPTEPPIF